MLDIRHSYGIPQLLGVSVGVRGAVVRLEDEEYCERTRREAAGGDAAGSSNSSTSAPETWGRATQCIPELELSLAYNLDVYSPATYYLN